MKTTSCRLRRLLVPVVLATALAASHGLMADGAWSLDTPVPTALAEVAVTAVNGIGYVAGGSNATGAVNTLYAFDPAAHTWTARAPYPGTARDHMAVAAYADGLYLAGGFTALPGPSVTTFQRYSPATNSWTTLAPLPRARGAFAMAAVNGRLYAVGSVVSHDDAESLNDVAEYDPGTNTWKARAPLPTARDHVAAVALDDRL